MRIFLVEDDPDHRLIIRHRLKELFDHSEVADFDNVVNCLEFLEEEKTSPDMIVSDLFLSEGMDGAEFYSEVRRRRIVSKFVLISSNEKELMKRNDKMKNDDASCFKKEVFFKNNIDDLRKEILKKPFIRRQPGSNNKSPL